MSQVLIDVLRKVPLFDGLHQEELEALTEAVVRRVFPRNSIIIFAEDRGETFFIIHRGRVKISLMSEEGREVILSILEDGEFFGDLSLLDGKPRSADVTAIEDTELCVLRRPDFLRLIHTVPQIAVEILGVLASRLRRADRMIASLTFLDITGRIADVLLHIADERGIEREEGVCIPDRPSYQTLASMVGTTRETVTRVIGRLQTQGYLSVEGQEITLLRKKLLNGWNYRRSDELD